MSFSKEPTHEFLRKIFIGFLSGTIASITNIPIDVVKSRIQVSVNFSFKFISNPTTLPIKRLGSPVKNCQWQELHGIEASIWLLSFEFHTNKNKPTQSWDI